MEGIQSIGTNGKSGLEGFKRRKSGITPLSKTKSIIPFIPFIYLTLPIKRKLSLSTPCLYMLFIILANSYNKIDNTASKLSELLYDGGSSHNGLRSVYYRIETLIKKDLVYKECNCYHLTDKAIQAISNIEL